MKLSWARNRGMTLIELLVSVGLGVSLSAAILQMFVGSVRLQSVHSAVQDLQHRSAYTQFLLRSAIRSSAWPCAADPARWPDGIGQPVEVHVSHPAAANAIPDSQVLRVRTGDCEVPVHFYYIGRRGNTEANLPGLYRRRQRNDRSYHAAEEMVSGVAGLTSLAGIRLSPATLTPSADAAVAYVSIDQVPDWSVVFSVVLHLSVQPLTDMARESGDNSALPVDGLALRFSSALRQSGLSNAPGGV